ncbi:MAG: ATP-binding cassette domain-containing protein, partial [Methanomicrobiales archaeon]|nr:ATP-binding cassette domain-containing protein [Methanomicrobiales archaeon]
FEQDLTARENVFLYGTIMGLTKKEIGSRYDAIMEFADLKRFEEMKYQNLSSGMKMRLAFSTAIQTDPDVMLLDEVLAVGDEAFKIKCMEKIDDLREAGTTVILVTHSLDQVKEICDRAVFLDHGAVIEEGDPEKVVAHYIETVLGGQTVRERRRKTRRKKSQPPSPISQAGQERGTG